MESLQLFVAGMAVSKWIANTTSVLASRKVPGVEIAKRRLISNRSVLFLLWQAKWCPAPGCVYSVEDLTGASSMDVLCRCGYNFCWEVSVWGPVSEQLPFRDRAPSECRKQKKGSLMVILEGASSALYRAKIARGVEVCSLLRWKYQWCILGFVLTNHPSTVCGGGPSAG
jgi:hypothetical protein